MFKYMMIRLTWLIIILFTIITLLYITSDIAVEMYFDDKPFNETVSPAITNYYNYIKNVVTKWDWGGTALKIPAWDLFKQAVVVSLRINLYAVAIYIPTGILLGVISAVKKGKITDKVIGVVTLITGALPSFIMIFILVIFFGYYTELLPPRYTFTDANPYLILVIPVIALALEPISKITRTLRGEIIEEVDSDYHLLLQVKGLNRRQILTRHILRNTMVPVLPIILSSFVFVLTNSFFIEMVYNVPGVAKEFFRALLVTGPFGSYMPLMDINTLVLISAFYSAVSMFFAFMMDVTYGLIDPRIRIGTKKAALD